MAAEEDVPALVERVDKLSVSATARMTTTDEDEEAAATTARVESGNVENGDGSGGETRLWGFETRELYKLAHNFYKGEPVFRFLRHLIMRMYMCVCIFVCVCLRRS